MRLITKLLIVAALCSTLTAFGSTSDADKAIYKRVDALMKKMTLQEKIGQLQQLTGRKSEITGPAGEKMNTAEFIRRGLCGSMLGVKTAKDVAYYQNIALNESRLGIPILFGYDIIHGCRIIFPENLGISSSWDIAAIEKSAQIAAREAASMGIAWTFSPMCDISTEPRWGRVSEGSGEDPYLGAKIAEAMVRGYQGDDLSDPNTILACVKHFAAYGAPQAGRDYHTVDMSRRMFRDRYLPPYRAAIKAGAATIMTSFNDFEGVPATGNKWLMRDLLRDELGFTGFIVTDWGATDEMRNHGVAANGKEAAKLAFDAHVNMNMVDADYIKYGEELVKEKQVSVKTIELLCREVLAMKFRLGLFDEPHRYGGDRYKSETYLPENLEVARDVARKSMVLLENHNATLPLKGSERIALIGPFANNRKEMSGAWIGFCEHNRSTTYLEGLQARFGKDNVVCVEGCKPFAAIEGGIAEAVAAAQNADVVLLTMGLPNSCSGEATSLTSIEVPQAQRDLLDALDNTGKPIVVLLVTGRPMDVGYEVERADALLVTWHAGTMAGPALADVVSGDFNPAGRLTMTFPLNIGQVPIHYNMKRTGRPRRSPEHTQKYTSRYMFTPNEPRYAFGYGLSYTTFDYSDLRVLTPEVAMGESVRVSVKVRNSGKCDGTEVVQLYLRDDVASTTRPMRELKGFERVELRAGEERRIEFEITPEDMSFWTINEEFAQEPGSFHVWVGHDSNATLGGEFAVRK